MAIEIIGPHPFERDDQGQLKTRVATIFPKHRILVTTPGIHAWQRLEFGALLNRRRQAAGLGQLGFSEEEAECAESVDLLIEPDAILIRPDPDRMKLALEADELLQELGISKRQIKFLFAVNDKVQQAIKARGECWRIAALPRSREEIRKMIADSKVAIRERPIYYQNRLTGTKYLTFTEFAKLGALPPDELLRHLEEIAEFSRRRNRLGNPEVDFFGADPLRFGARDFADLKFKSGLSPEAVRAKFNELCARFKDAVPLELQHDDLDSDLWCTRMFTTIVTRRDETLAEELLEGLSPEFFLQIEWLPGGRFEEGEFIFDTVFEEAEQHPDDPELIWLCDPCAKGFIFNFIRQYGDIEYVNVGRVGRSLSRRAFPGEGRRGVYIAELKLRSVPTPIVRFIRMQKWGIRERLDEGKDLLRAIIESEEYTEYILDRRLGCRQLGMNLPRRVNMHRVTEVYNGTNAAYRGQLIWATYFERDYVRGIATDKLSKAKFSNAAYAEAFARLLGRAAASNIIVGRAYGKGQVVLFDDGDEVIIEGPDGIPQDLVVCDHTGAFDEYQRPLYEFAAQYAQPINSRTQFVPNPRAFAETYLDAFKEAFCRIQGDYRKRRRAFDTLFKHRPYSTEGSFAYRWECVLRRLDNTEPDTLTDAIRKHISVLNPH
ncbi:MAG: hypothetical protein N2379_08400 [Verrucomicrobiae bacterium]|nr:hypothetical protein [Verrucomicrobiae bacterium]